MKRPAAQYALEKVGPSNITNVQRVKGWAIYLKKIKNVVVRGLKHVVYAVAQAKCEWRIALIRVVPVAAAARLNVRGARVLVIFEPRIVRPARATEERPAKFIARPAMVMEKSEVKQRRIAKNSKESKTSQN